MTYRIADGHDNEANFADVSPQPRSRGILSTRRTVSLSGTVTDEAEYVEWEFTALTDSQYSTLLTAFGLAAATSNEVTIRTMSNARTLVNKNGTIILPEMGVDAKREMGFYRDVRFIIRDLSAT